MAEKTATFALNLESNAGAVSAAATSGLEAFRSTIEKSQAELKGMQGALKSLKGSSDEVAKAKEQLKAKIEAEKGVISQANLALVKQGTTYTKVTSELKKLTGEVVKETSAQGKLRDGVKLAGGPVADLSSKFDNLKGVLSGANAGAAALGIGVGLLVVGVVALTAATIEAGIKLGKFVIEGANTLRSMNLMREAAAGSAENAKNLGTQVDRLARMVPTAKDKINELAVAMTRDMSGGLSKATGPAIVASLEAVTVASAAAGEGVGRALQDIVERGKNFGRFWLSPQDLDKTGLRFEQVAQALAKNMGVSIEKARQALFTGGVGLTAGATALKDAVNKRFGEVNAEKLLDVDVQLDKLKENLVGLTRGVVLTPLLKGLSILAQEFDITSVKGQQIQAAFTKIGEAIVHFSVDHIEDFVKGVEGLISVGVSAVSLFSKWEPKIKGVVDAFLDSKVAMMGLKAAGAGIVAVVATVGLVLGSLATAVGVAVAVTGAPFYALYKGYTLLADLNWGKIGTAIVSPFKSAWAWLKGLDLADLGRSIIDGIVNGITGAAGRAVDAVKGLVGSIKDAFMGSDGIDAHSPSKVFEKGGRDTDEGYAQGIEKGTPRVQAAAQAMAPSPPGPRGGIDAANVWRGGGAPGGGAVAAAFGGGAGGGAAGGPIGPIHLEFNFDGAASHEKAEEIAKRISAPNVLREITRAVREGMITQGIPTQAPVL